MEGNTPTSTGTQPTGSLHDAAAAFGQILTLEEDTQEKVEATPEGDEAAPAAETTEGQPEEAEAQAETEQAESDDAETQEEQATEPQFTVRIDGKDTQVSESELIAGYSRQADYTRKTQALSTERKTLEAETEAARNERAEMATLLPKLRAALEDGMGDEPDWAKLRAENPTEANTQWQLRQERKEKIAAVKHEEQRLAEKAEQEQRALLNQVLVDEREKMLTAMPQWKDQKVASSDAKAIEVTLRAAGFSDKDLNIYDHRAMLIAWKAMKYDAIQAQQPGLKKKIEVAPVVKPGAKKQSANANQAALDRFNKSGSVKDAAGVLKNFL